MQQGASTDAEPTRRFGPVRLLPSVTPTHVAVFLFIDLITIGFIVFVNISQAYLMNTKLAIPESIQGTISGDLGFWSEVTIVAMVWLFGMLADKTSRRLVMSLGLAFLGASYLAYPLSESADGLLLSRLVYAVGVAATTCMLTVMVHDYPQESSRGKLVAASGICGGFGAAMIGALGGAMPDFFVSRGASELDAAFYMNWVAAAICIAAAAIAAVGAHPGIPGGRPAKSGFRESAAIGLRAARRPRIRVLYFSAFAARGDLVIAGTFIVLWGTLAGQAQGLDTTVALGRGTLLFVITSITTLICAPFMGILLDRFDRLMMLAAGAVLATVGFGAVGLIENPLDPAVIPLFVLLGIGQSSCFYASQALIGQEAPLENRGAVIGAFSACGAVGVLIANGIGGRLFDSIDPGAPFLMVAGATALLAIYAVWVRLRERAQAN